MIKITSPSALSPFDRPVVFGFSSTAPSADALKYIDAVIEDAVSGAVVAARRIHLDKNASAQLDVAPMLRRALALQPVAGATGLAAADDSMFNVRMRVGSVRTDAVKLLCTAPQRNALTLLSDMPRQRTIGSRDCDRLLFYCMSDFTVFVDVQTAAGSKTYSYNWDGDDGLVAFRLRAGDFGSDVRRIVVRTGVQPLVEYEVESAAGDSVRLAWRTGSGIVEHFTFPVVARRTLVADRRTVRLSDGTSIASVASRTELTLRSQCDASAAVEALAAIAASPQVWAVDRETGQYASVEVLTQQVVTHAFGEPSNVELTVRPSQNGTRL